ncbi:MAG: AraC family transcriptional regulator ligand-binding domain-containing protein [Polyangiaceae bacterium]
MGAVTQQIVRRFVEVSLAPLESAAWLEGEGLALETDVASAARQPVSADLYYELLERCAAQGDHGLPFRYGTAIRPEDFGAFGLAIKTARTVGDALERLVRYILVITDTLEYQLVDEAGGRRFILAGRSSEQRRGIQIANEAALAAVWSILRQVTVDSVVPELVSFRQACPADAGEHRRHFGCRVRFEAGIDALHLSERVLATQTRLGDEGLSAFLLSQLDELHAQRAERSLVAGVRRAVTDALCDGVPRKGRIARQLGMSERTLQRHLAEGGRSFQALVDEVRREVAEQLLVTTTHSLSEVAFLTGFSEQSAFQRAFKRWTGRTPLAFRGVAG